MANEENRGRDLASLMIRGRDLASIMITGRLVADAEVRTSKSGKEFVTYTVACQTYNKEKANFFDCMQSGALGWLKKGMSVTVTGTPDFSEFTDKEGHQRRSFRVLVNGLTAFGGQNGNGTSKPAAKPEPASEDVGEEVDEDDDLPF